MVVFMTALNKEAWQSVPRGSGVLSFWRESQCKNAKVNKEWLLLRNKQRERACKVGSVVRESEGGPHSARQGHTSMTGLNGFSNHFCLFGKQLWMREMNGEDCLAFLYKQLHGDSLRRWRMMFLYHHKCKVKDKINMRLPLVQETWCQILLIIVTWCECGCTDETLDGHERAESVSCHEARARRQS